MLHEANLLSYELWLNTVVFTWRWWALIFLSVGSWIAWIIWRDKKIHIAYFLRGCSFQLLLFTWIPFGLALGLWSYPIKDIPLIPGYITWDFCVIPVTTMFLLQFKPKVNPIIKSVTLAAFGAFIAQPMAVWIKYYHMKHWQPSYTFILIIIIYLLAYFFYNGRTWQRTKKTTN